jgi:hypothetical protein
LVRVPRQNECDPASWSETTVEDDGASAVSGSPDGENPPTLELTASERHYVEEIMALTLDQLAAGHGIGPIDRPSPGTRDVPTTAAVVAGARPKERLYVEVITALTPEQLAAAFGTI